MLIGIEWFGCRATSAGRLAFGRICTFLRDALDVRGRLRGDGLWRPGRRRCLLQLLVETRRVPQDDPGSLLHLPGLTLSVTVKLRSHVQFSAHGCLARCVRRDDTAIRSLQYRLLGVDISTAEQRPLHSSACGCSCILWRDMAGSRRQSADDGDRGRGAVGVPEAGHPFRVGGRGGTRLGCVLGSLPASLCACVPLTVCSSFMIL